jgi:predicted secreted protein
MAYYSGYGCVLKRGDGGSPEVFTTVAGITHIGGPDMKVDMIDVTSMDSPNGWREFIGGLKDGGSLRLTCNFDPQTATQSYSTGLLKDFVNRTKRNFQLVLSDAGATTWSFAGFVTDFPVDMPVDGKLSVDITIKITGQPTLA